MGAASNAYQAYSNLSGTAMGATGTGLVAGAGVVGGAYGVYTGIQDMLKNGVNLSNGATTALSAYSTYASASSLYTAMAGEGAKAFAGAGGFTAITDAIGNGLSYVGTAMVDAFAPVATEMGTQVGAQVGTTLSSGSGVGFGAGGAGATATTGASSALTSISSYMPIAGFVASAVGDILKQNASNKEVTQTVQTAAGRGMLPKPTSFSALRFMVIQRTQIR